MKMRITASAAVLCLTLLNSPATLGQVRDWLNNNSINNGSTVRDLIATFRRLGTRYPGYGDELKRLQGNIGLVFVPGILGSSLKSPSAGAIWAIEPPDPEKLRLPRELINPETESDVQAELAESVMGVSLYGESIKMVRASAEAAGIAPARIAACGYDWRRDIRAGARDLKKCIESSPQLAGVEALVIVAHSMGGLVTWQWHTQYAPEGRLAGGARVLAVALLGSPLAGSCEIVRMIQAGYVQPTADDRYASDGWLKRFWTEIMGMKDRVVNAFSSSLTDGIRPVVLTWPGAMELSPPPAATRDDNNCASIPLVPEDATDARLLSHYLPDFWNKPIGQALLSGHALPETYVDVLETAGKFRGQFAAATIASPTYLFASQVWITPARAPVTDTFTLANNTGWSPALEGGDGRVPFNSAMPTAVRAADAMRVYSLHGNLPEDRVFHDEFFGQRLPRVLSGWIATRLLKRAASDPVFLGDYLGSGGRFANPRDFHAAWERQNPQNQRDPIYPLTIEGWNAAVDFNNALCEFPGVCPDYARARALAQGKTNAQQAGIYTAALSSGRVSNDEAAILLAQRGLAMARDQNWAAAIGDLRDALPVLEATHARRGEREPANHRDLRIAANANLGRALAIRGYCGESGPYLERAAAAGNDFAVKTPRAPCYDRESGRIAMPGG